MSLETYLQELEQNSKASKDMYLAALNIRHALPELRAEFDIETDLPVYLERIHHGPFLWIGQGGHHEYMHVDADEGMLMVIDGQKSVKLIKIG